MAALYFHALGPNDRVAVKPHAGPVLHAIHYLLGQRVAPLGVEKFGQTGNLADLYAAYRLDGEAITQAIAELLLNA